MRTLEHGAALLMALTMIAGPARGQSTDREAIAGPRRQAAVVPLVDFLAAQNFLLRIYGRRDGWVELELETIPPHERPTPWLVTAHDYPRLGHPARSRAYIRPGEVRRAIHTADSLIDHPATRPGHRDMTLSPDHPRHGNLFVNPNVAIRMAEREAPHDTLDWIFSDCYSLGEANGWELGTGRMRTASESRAILRALQAGVDWTNAVDPQPLHADLIDAIDAACPVRPKSRSAPAYPEKARGRTADVHLDAIVDTTGHVIPSSIRVVLGGDSVFVNTATAALREAEFEPAMLTVEAPVAQRVHVQYHFAPVEPRGLELQELMESASVHGAEILVLSRERPTGSRRAQLDRAPSIARSRSR